jgi:hypothetical protein
MKKILLIILALFIFAAAPTPSFAADTMQNEPSSSAIIFDVILARPLGLAGAVLGTGFFVIALPFSVTTGSVGITARKLIGEPLAYTFGRPLGQMD